MIIRLFDEDLAVIISLCVLYSQDLLYLLFLLKLIIIIIRDLDRSRAGVLLYLARERIDGNIFNKVNIEGLI